MAIKIEIAASHEIVEAWEVGLRGPTKKVKGPAHVVIKHDNSSD